MDVELIPGLILNVALLITLSAVYEAFSWKLPDGINRKHRASFPWVSGVILAAMVLAVMNTHFHAAPGVLIDSRSILISLGALFFGLVPAVIAATVALVFRFLLGGAGTIAGVMIILSSLAIGLLWRWRFRNREYQIPALELYAMNFLVHMATVGSLWFFLPDEINRTVTQNLVLPILVLFPLVGFMLSRLIQGQVKQKMAQAELQGLRWMLDPSSNWEDYEKEFHNGSQSVHISSLNRYNKHGMILHTLGEELLAEIVNDYMRLLATSSVIFEKDGHYAYAMFASGWCQQLEQASIHGCRGLPENSPQKIRNYHCHTSSWEDCARQCVETGREMDVACRGGLRIFALPIFVGKEVVGAINFGYGSPPVSRQELQKLSQRYGM